MMSFLGTVKLHNAAVNSDSSHTLLNEHPCLLTAGFIKWLPQLPLPLPLLFLSALCAPSLSTTDEGW